MAKAKRFEPFAAPRSFHLLHDFQPVSLSSDFSRSTIDAIVADAEQACIEASEDGDDVLHDQFDDGWRILMDRE